MKANNFKYAPVYSGIGSPKEACPTGKVKLGKSLALRRAEASDDIKGGMVAYKCRGHWHVGHTPFNANNQSERG